MTGDWGCERDSFRNYSLGKNWLGHLLMAQRAVLRWEIAQGHQFSMWA